jgi:perosamine synthetase
MKNNAVAEYERRFADEVGASHAFSFWKGRVALYAILRGLGVGEGDEVIVPGFTCIVVPNAIINAGAKPVYADIAPGSYNLDPLSVEKAITPRSRVLIIQHTFGLPADMDVLMTVAAKHGLIVIEDCAHTLGSTYRGRKLGAFGIASFFSSQWSKPFTTGLGGMAVTSDPSLAQSLKAIQSEFLRPSRMHVARLKIQYLIHQKLLSPRLYWPAMKLFHGLSRWNLFVGSSSIRELDGYMESDHSWKMSESQARIGLSCLSKLFLNLSHRRRLADLYRECLNAKGWDCAPNLSSCEATLLRYPVCVENKWEVLDEAVRERVELGSWFESPLHPVHSGLERFKYYEKASPVAEDVCNKVINLPLHAKISKGEAQRTIDFVLRTGKKPAEGFYRREELNA